MNQAVACTHSRFALIIANSEYTDSYKPLKCPVLDARRMEKELKWRGFHVTVRVELEYRPMISQLGAFVQAFKARQSEDDCCSEVRTQIFLHILHDCHISHSEFWHCVSVL